MSKFEDYNTTSRNYDNQRFALGADVASGMIQFYTNKPLKDLHVLDAGCGTGNIALEMIKYGTGRFTLLDASEGMLEKAKAKLSDYIDNGKVIEIAKATMPLMPFLDRTFDAAMFNLVLHHLVSNADGQNFPTIEATLKETRRVLKPGGIVSICTINPFYVYPRTWFAQLNEDITSRHTKQYPTLTQWEDIFRKTGFDMVNMVQVKVALPPKSLSALSDGEGPMKKEWRDCDSYWASATAEEIADVEKKIIQMKKEGTLQKFVEENDKLKGKWTVEFLFGRIKS